jgi:hypothetical protein
MSFLLTKLYIVNFQLITLHFQCLQTSVNTNKVSSDLKLFFFKAHQMIPVKHSPTPHKIKWGSKSLITRLILLKHGCIKTNHTLTVFKDRKYFRFLIFFEKSTDKEANRLS